MASVTHQALLMVGGTAAAAPPGGGWFAPLATVPSSVARDRFLQARAEASSYANSWLHPIAAVVTPGTYGWSNRLATVAPRARDASLIDPSAFANQWIFPPAPLDGLGATVAYSFSRKLVASYGGPFYTTDTGAIDKVFDQSGNVRDAVQITAGFRPLPTTAGPNSRACADFDGSNDYLVGATAISNIITASSGYFITTVLVDAVANNNAGTFQNNALFADDGSYIGVFAKNVGGATPTFLGYNWDANDDATGGTAFSLATVYVLTWRHEGGTLYLSVNGAAETTAFSGNTFNMTGFLKLGAAGASTHHNGRIFELAGFSTVPNATQRATLIQKFGLWAGAAV